MSEVIEPMLASGITDYSKLTFPKYISPKLDGVRAIVNNGVVYSRSGKPIRSKAVQEMFRKQELNMLDGELIYGDPTAHDVFNKTSSFVMSTKVPEGMDASRFMYFVFDIVDDYLPFDDRYCTYCETVFNNQVENVVSVSQYIINSHSELEEQEMLYLDQGYEGAMLRNPYSLYKHGRATEKSQDLLKVKRFVDDEAEIIGFEELMHNNNVATTNELGYTERSSHKENLVGMDTLGALVCRTKDDVEFKIGTGFDEATRKDLWNKRSTLLGELAKFKSFPIGVKDKPRLPVFLGIRDKLDL